MRIGIKNELRSARGAVFTALFVILVAGIVLFPTSYEKIAVYGDETDDRAIEPYFFEHNLCIWSLNE